MFKKFFSKNYLFLIPTSIASLTLFYGLDTVYKNLISDEKTMLLIADLLKGSHYYPYFIFADGAGTTHTLLHYLMQIPLTIFGYSVFALRFIPALLGLLGVVLMFFLAKNIFSSNKIALFSSLLLAASTWYLAFSRTAIEISEIVFFSILNLFFLTLFINNQEKDSLLKFGRFTTQKSLVYLFLTGISFGLVQHTYQSARFYVLFYFIFFPIFWIIKKSHFRNILQQSLVFGSGFAVTLSPLVYAYLQHPNYFDSRRAELIFYHNLSPNDFFWALKQSILRTLGMFHFRGSDVICYNIPDKPMLDVISGSLLAIGSIFSFRVIKKTHLLVLWLFFFVSLTPSFFSYWPATPQILRAAGAVIPAYLLIGLGLEKSRLLLKGRLGLLSLIVILSAIFYLNLKTYFFDLPSLQKGCQRYSIETLSEYKQRYLETTKGIKFIR